MGIFLEQVRLPLDLFNVEDLDDEEGKAGNYTSKGQEQGLEMNGHCGMEYRKTNVPRDLESIRNNLKKEK